ncbi:MAG: PAS domain-containing sensor histidine kinase [Gammaproteobacteria bacterium]|nr:PAS domain-containing sensor histidine kinase [Gammaproteobacteria bacterium]
MRGEFILYVLLSLIAIGAVFGAHVLRARLTLGLAFGVAATLTFLLWQMLLLGWWVTVGTLNFHAATTSLVPALMLGVALAYAMDGLRTARAYLYVVLAIGLLGWGFAEFRELLARFTPMPYAFSLSWRTHLGILAGLFVGGIATMLAGELVRRASPLLALPASFLAGLFVWFAITSFFDYGAIMGLANFVAQGPELALAALLPAVLAGGYGLYARRIGQLLPARPFGEVLTFWRSVEGNLREMREDVLAANHMISDLKRLNFSLEEAEKARDYQMQLSPVPTLLTSAEGMVRRINPAAEALFGSAATGRGFAQLLGERGGHAPPLAELARSRAALALELPPQDGHPARFLEVSALPLAPGGKTVGYTVLLRDQTAKTLAARRAAAETRVREIHRTGKTIAHDFSNLLMALESNLEALQGSAPSPGTAADMRAAIRRGRDLLGQLGVAEVLEAPRLEPVALAPLLVEALHISQAIARAKGIRLALEPPPEVQVDVHPAQIQRVFTNLINNALRATPPGGAVTIAARADADGVSVDISDTGQGMSAAQLAQAFEPGFSTKGEGQGGLGLSISYLIVDAHGGRLALERNADGGMTAAIWLPRASNASAADQAGLRDDFSVIVASPLPQRAARLAEALEQAGIATVAEAHSAEEVAALVADHPGSWQALFADAPLAVVAPVGLLVVDARSGQVLLGVAGTEELAAVLSGLAAGLELSAAGTQAPVAPV